MCKKNSKCSNIKYLLLATIILESVTSKTIQISSYGRTSDSNSTNNNNGVTVDGSPPVESHARRKMDGDAVSESEVALRSLIFPKQ